jgi:hypothetical protein
LARDDSSSISDRAAFRTAAAVPLLMIALGVPLVFRLVPRNWFYGQRTLRTLRGPEEIWYRQNTITGVAMLLIGIVWLVARHPIARPRFNVSCR